MISDCQHYVDTVLALYCLLPDTPNRHSRYDRLLARQLWQQKVPLPVIESAFVLATARRLLRDPSHPPLNPIRSLHYFVPVLEEVLAQPLPPTYLQYLRHKLAAHQPPVNLPPNLP